MSSPIPDGLRFALIAVVGILAISVAVALVTSNQRSIYAAEKRMMAHGYFKFSMNGCAYWAKPEDIRAILMDDAVEAKP